MKTIVNLLHNMLKDKLDLSTLAQKNKKLADENVNNKYIFR